MVWRMHFPIPPFFLNIHHFPIPPFFLNIHHFPSPLSFLNMQRPREFRVNDEVNITIATDSTGRKFIHQVIAESTKKSQKITGLTIRLMIPQEKERSTSWQYVLSSPML
ncbi:hypothetical protein DPMN_160151 [Dreissena polymorpha]|uniref:Uncharacterized protein n=1 Tax=Dreissena polymorpha TaxID=45954 RepID=A0A9D4IRD2_DREPO|nr:hypothetical protein DPMN_160151 [Dreissena polymorpha]